MLDTPILTLGTSLLLAGYISRTGSKGKLSRNALYKLANEAPQQLRMSTFDTLIPALKTITGKPVKLTDLLDYTDEAN